jgi:acyl dehydratase
VYAESEVVAKRESQSRPTQGIVTVRTRGTTQDGKVFITFDRTILVPKKGHAVEDLATA